MSESTIYRSSTIAQCLSSSVDELVADDRLDADTADAIMDQFDKSMIKHLYRSAKTRCFIKGTQVSHNSCEGVWLFDVKNVQLTNDHGHVICADKMKIVAIDQSLAKVSDD